MNNLRYIQPRSTVEDIIRRAEATERKARWIAFVILVGMFTAFVALGVCLCRGLR